MKPTLLLTVITTAIIATCSCNRIVDRPEKTIDQIDGDTHLKQMNELNKLQQFIDSLDQVKPDYFLKSDWKILFAELEDSDIENLVKCKWVMYKTVNAEDANSRIYVVSSSPYRVNITSKNCIAAWVY